MQMGVLSKQHDGSVLHLYLVFISLCIRGTFTHHEPSVGKIIHIKNIHDVACTAEM